MQKVTLTVDTRCFQGATSNNRQLVWDRTSWIRRGTDVSIGEAVEKIYDHRDQFAVPFEWEGHTGFFLCDELEVVARQ